VPLFRYQREGVQFLERRNGRALLADEMGLGKTIQALGWLAHRHSLRPVVVVCPTTARLNWQKEIDTWLSERAFLPYGTRADASGYNGEEFIVIHYDIAVFWLDWLKALRPAVVIVDEAHLIKTSTARRTKAVKALCRGVPHVIGLTGTPIINRPIEAWNIIQVVDKKALNCNWFRYTRRYCGPRHNGFAWTYTGATRTKELHALLTSTLMLRRTKSEVLDSLPPKIYSFVPLELDNRVEYQKAETHFLRYVRETAGRDAAARAKRAETLTRITALRDLAAKGKLAAALEWIADTIELNKLVVFAVHRQTIDAVCARFKGAAVKIDGGVSEKDRALAIERFQTDPDCRLFVGQIQAAGTAITLTAASHVAFLSLPWTPGETAQAADRVHRLGQTQQVTVYYLLAHQTIDEHMARLIDNKRKVLDAVLDGAASTTPSILRELLRLYEERGKDESTTLPDKDGPRVRADNRAGI
jgi:SWI/SNF-related matrix-associated actin-dependent regulator of chromatin subfamily A-like protein 1